MKKFIFKKYLDEEIVQFVKLLSKNNYKITMYSDNYGYMNVEIESNNIPCKAKSLKENNNCIDTDKLKGSITVPANNKKSSRMCWFCKYTGGTILTSNPPKVQCSISNEYRNTYDTCNLPDEVIIKETGCNPDEFRKDISEMHTVCVDYLL